jgi:group I intron endonuclease
VTAGIYAITSPSGKQYIGSAVDLRVRWMRHRAELRSGVHHNAPLLAAYLKYGLDALRFGVLCQIEDITKLIFFEQAAFEAYRPAYNVARIAGSCVGTSETEAARQNRAAALARPDVRARISAAGRGRLQTSEHVAKRVASKAGYTHNAETRAKITAALAGRTASDETKAKMSATRRGRPRSPEAVAKGVATRAAQRSAAAAETKE